MANRCRNCKYYEKYKDSAFYGECTCPKMEYESAYCYERNQRTNNKEIEKDKLFYMDYESYSAGIEVGENFGCVHFSKKEEK